MSIWNIQYSQITGELCFVQPADVGSLDQVWDMSTMMSLEQAQIAGIEVPCIGSFGHLDNCLVFSPRKWDCINNGPIQPDY